jgi:hypothetical protein
MFLQYILKIVVAKKWGAGKYIDQPNYAVWVNTAHITGKTGLYEININRTCF